ncbi:hypothetical protein, variant [Aphanomyces invadans]|uniref:Mis18 domain-containing protein n=1 Tax=Aphanomyces invadans TaxID=157072 RepID=A0A024TPU9_9STRA|nr:hypothetical protein, variant [Aphanomyces invadans]ETV96048.1 hypothetical protein, variant [Aphanomyces invadans]|eukprot:XP_008875359.1 hypothetical protein, variant [Aphanomyces invadans]
MSDEDGMAEVLVAFQCKTCSLIVGDSVNLMHVNEARRTVTLKYAVNIIRSTVAIHAAAGGEDAGNTYHDLLCRQCKRILGKWYSATVPAFDAYRMAYTLHADDVTEYAVGANAPEDQWSMEGAVAVDEWKANVLHMRDLSKRLAKAQLVLKMVHDRILISERLVQARRTPCGVKRQRTIGPPQLPKRPGQPTQVSSKEL